MVKIVIENLGKKEVVINDFSLTVLRQLHSNAIDWMHACGGKGRCTTCKMIVLEGMTNLSPPTAAELRYRDLGVLSSSERLTCQVSARENIVIRVPEEYKLPHIAYSD